MSKQISAPMLPEADLKLAEKYAESVRKLLQENSAHRCSAILGLVMATGNLMQDEIAEDPQRMGFYIRCVAKLAEAVTPEPGPQLEPDFMRH